MSGIVGILDAQGQSLDPALLERMTGSLAHRGPNGRRWWTDRWIGMGQLFFRTTPESFCKREPMPDESSGCYLAWDGRIDNREELLCALGVESHRREIQTDPDLVLAAYRRWGLDCLKKILGDFAFAVWDEGRNRLFCARDPLGVKPFYYSWDGRRLIFGSEIKAILECPSVPRRPNEKMIADYLLLDFRDPEATFFEGIKQLPPAHFLCFEQGMLRVSRYWDFDPRGEIRYSSDSEYLEEFREIFRKAVHCRLRTRSPAGALLSGGIDSVSVTAMTEAIRQNNGGGPEFAAFTLLAEGLLQEEWDAILRLTRTCGTTIHSILPVGEDGAPLSLFEMHLDCAETPHYDDFMAIPLTLAPVARSGCRVLLTGVGADELSRPAERGFLKDILYSGPLIRLRHEIKSESLAYGGNGNWKGLVLYDLWSQLPSQLRWLLKAVSGKNVPEWFDSSFAKRAHLWSRMKPSPHRKFRTFCAEESYRTLTAPSLVLALNQMDGLASAFGVECRHPYLDRRLIEFYLSIPPSVKMKFGYRKMFVQRSLEGIVPGPLRGRLTEECFVPEMELRRCLAVEAERMRTTLHGHAIVSRYIDHTQTNRIMERYLRGEAEPSCRCLLWRFMKLEVWLQKWFAETEAEPRKRDWTETRREESQK